MTLYVIVRWCRHRHRTCSSVVSWRTCFVRHKLWDPCVENWHCWTCPGVFSSPLRPPKNNHPQPTQKRLPIKTPHHQYTVPGTDPLNSPHLRINCEDPTEYSCPGWISDHVLTSSTTRISNPLTLQKRFEQPFPTTNTTRRVPVKWVRTIRSLVPVRGTTPPSIPLSLHWCQKFGPKSGQTRWSEIGSRVSKPPRTWLRHRD